MAETENENGIRNYEHAVEIIEGLSMEDFGKFAVDIVGEEFLMDIIRNAMGMKLYSGDFDDLSKEETLLSIGISNDMISRMEVLDGK